MDHFEPLTLSASPAQSLRVLTPPDGAIPNKDPANIQSNNQVSTTDTNISLVSLKENEDKAEEDERWIPLSRDR